MMMILFFVFLVLLILDLAVVAVLQMRINSIRGHEQKKHKGRGAQKYAATVKSAAPLQSTAPVQSAEAPAPAAPALSGHEMVSVGKVHNIGRRGAQQDSLCTSPVFQNDGILAIVADGMGGLSGGDEVSQRIVMKALSLAANLSKEQMGTALPQMLDIINQDVNQMLGPDRLYKSGSTLTAVLTCGNVFHWLTVGDSRIYFYREGYMFPLNRDHDLFQDWMPEILDGRRSYEESIHDPEGRKLTSFIGMGKLRYTDYSHTAIDLMPGDRILLMSDGVYNTLSDEQMVEILKRCPDVAQAAAVFEKQILAAQIPSQDNFTAIILGF